MREREREQIPVSLSDKRLLNIEEFCIYAGIGQNTARIVAETTGSSFRIGRRVLVDRVKFDRFCDEHSEVETEA